MLFCYHFAPAYDDHAPSWNIRSKPVEGYERLSLRFTQEGFDAVLLHVVVDGIDGLLPHLTGVVTASSVGTVHVQHQRWLTLRAGIDECLAVRQHAVGGGDALGCEVVNR